MTAARLVALSALTLCLSLPALAQSPPAEAPADAPAEAPAEAPADAPAEAPAEDNPLAKFGWVPGPTTAELGSMAKVDVPDGYLFLAAADTRKFLELLGNVPGGREQGMVLNAEKQWFVVFDFSPEGYVRDDDKDDIDADAILDAMKAGGEAGNEARRKRGFSTVTLVGWAREPAYDDTTKHLEWAIKLKDDGNGGESINHQARLLGRRGIMEATLVCDPQEFEGALPQFHAILGKYEFQDGHRYSQFVSGDKIAEYGLTGLMLGGAVAIGAKSGFFKAIWKFLVLGVLAIGALLKRVFGGRGES